MERSETQRSDAGDQKESWVSPAAHPTYTLPTPWAWATPLEIGEAALGKMLDRAKHTEGCALPYLRNLNVRWGAFDLSDLLTMRFRDGELARYEVRRGDLMICEGGEPGRCAVWNQQSANIKYQKAVHRLRLYDGINPYFIMYQFMHDAWQGQLVQFFTDRRSSILQANH